MSEKQFSLRDTIAPKSDQLNYDDLISCSLTVKVSGLAAGSVEQPVIIKIVNAETCEAMRDYKPCKSMRRVLIAAWGDKGREWIGKEMTLFGESRVSYGGVEVGGIRISHLSHIEKEMKIKLTTTRSKRSEFVVRPLIREAK